MPDLADLLLKAEIEDFLTREAELLDERRFDEWLDLLADDVQYSMPMVRNVKHDALDQEYTRAGRDAMWFDEGKHELALRVEQLQSGDHWAEEPRSRTTHLVAGIRVVERSTEEVTVNSRFLVYRTRLGSEVDLIAGKRTDLLRRQDGSWKIARRHVLIDQSTLTARNLTTFC
ncbi:MAG TPA: 3-phenylpropionate/cinnamic acid dioxygenase subunit beta [Chloroflexota bacterium]|nr:3-phenylpropionate/cinnamic acid dioxygenase subunit beta [Chloroflexota bacterium]